MTDQRSAPRAVPEGLCTACSATQYCREHEPLSADPAPRAVPSEPQEILDMHREMCAYLDTLTITGLNIGEIRRSLFVPWDSLWNDWVREDTAARETSFDPETQREPLSAAPRAVVPLEGLRAKWREAARQLRVVREELRTNSAPNAEAFELLLNNCADELEAALAAVDPPQEPPK
jgi:hypothetical protein